MHKLGFSHGQLNEHNITADARLVDLATVAKMQPVVKDGKKTLRLDQEKNDCKDGFTSIRNSIPGYLAKSTEIEYLKGYQKTRGFAHDISKKSLS